MLDSSWHQQLLELGGQTLRTVGNVQIAKNKDQHFEKPAKTLKIYQLKAVYNDISRTRTMFVTSFNL
jgi:hypothetical protein